MRITDKTIEIFYNHTRIASHLRLYGRKGQYSTSSEHIPEDHQKYLEWNGDRFRKWAERLGSNTYQVINGKRCNFYIPSLPQIQSWKPFFETFLAVVFSVIEDTVGKNTVQTAEKIRCLLRFMVVDDIHIECFALKRYKIIAMFIEIYSYIWYN